MYGRTKATLLGSAAITALLISVGPSFAVEPGDFQATLRGVLIGIPTGAAPPPGLYFDLTTFTSGANGVGQNSAANGTNLGHGLSVFGQALEGSLIWNPGWSFLGGTPYFTVAQPFFTVAGFDTNCVTNALGGCSGTQPIAFGAGSGAFFENVHNTIWTARDSWNWHNGWFTSLGLGIQGPDGSQYMGTLNQDYWTFTPKVGIAYIDKQWQLSANFAYDIHTASQGKTGTYAALQANAPVPLPSTFDAPGIGYTTGNQLFIDWAAKYNIAPKWEAGPVGYFKFQTTADSPGSGFTCASLKASPVYGPLGLTCGNANDIGLGAVVGYHLGPAHIELYATDSVYTQDDFKGWSVFSRVSFKLTDDAPPAKPLITK